MSARLLFASALGVAIAFGASARSPFANLSEISSQVGLSRYAGQIESDLVRIAIFDNGFEGFPKSRSDGSLPGDVRLESPVRDDLEGLKDSHGLAMAQIVSGLLTENMNEKIRYEIHLFPVAGYSNLLAAVDKVVAANQKPESKYALVLHSIVKDYGGNRDGKGFFNTLIERVAKSGSLWINAAGNFGQLMYEAPVVANNSGYAKLPAQGDTVRVRCRASAGERCDLRVVLSWNSVSDSPTEGTNKDLDLELLDDGVGGPPAPRGGSALTQSTDASAKGAGFSSYPWEIVTESVPVGLYRLRVKIKTPQLFNASVDRLTIAVSGANVTLEDRSIGETILPMADSPYAITVGALDDSASSYSARLSKPELVAPGQLRLRAQKGAYEAGNSISAAVVAAGAAVMLGYQPDATRAQIIKFGGTAMASSRGPLANGKGYSLRTLGFAESDAEGNPSRAGCFLNVRLPNAPETLSAVLKDGGIPVLTTGGYKVFMAEDPLVWLGRKGVNLGRRQRADANEMIVAGPDGYEMYPRGAQKQIAQRDEYFEIVQTPFSAQLCDAGSKPPVNSTAKVFQLPSPGDWL